jgi:predicted RND superfamily exporter protein
VLYNVKKYPNPPNFSLGSTVAQHPWRTVSITWLSVALISLGLFSLQLESHTLKTLLPADYKFVKDTDWFLNNFDELIRTENVIVQAPNVLEPEVLRKIAKITLAVQSLAVRMANETVNWPDVCLK